MRSDLEVIIKKYPLEQDTLRIYAIGDVHVGSREFDEESIKKKIRLIKDDPCGAVVLCGDLGDYGLKNSKTNVYQAVMQPKEQQEYLYYMFYPIKDKITAAVPGNHEERITREVGLCPLYDLCVRWGIEDVYRENAAITKYVFGSARTSKRQVTFVGLTTHGSSRNKHHKFAMCFDGLDFAISGHTHTPEYSPRGRIRINRQYGTASHVPYKEIVVDATLKTGGYGLKKEYEIPAPPELQYLELSYRFNREDRGVIRAMDYHSIQI